MTTESINARAMALRERRLNDPYAATISDSIGKKLMIKGISQKELARRMGITPETLSRFMSCQKRITDKNLNKAALALGTTAEELTGGVKK